MKWPEGVAGVPVAWHIVLADTEDYAVVLSDVMAYATGLKLTMLLRYPAGSLGGSKHGQPPRLLVNGTDSDSPRLGVGFADGRKVVLGHSPYSWRVGEGPVLQAAGQGAGGRGWQRGGLWLWPLPPSGPVTFGVDWEAVGLGERLIVADGTELERVAIQGP